MSFQRLENSVCVRVHGINPFFLLAFLLSKYGQQIHKKTQKGTVRGLISRENVHYIPIPAPDEFTQNWYQEIILRSELLRGESELFYGEAQNFIESELGLDKLTFQKPVGYISQVSNIETSRRFDSEHYFPAFSAFWAGLPSRIALSPLRNHLEFCQRGKQPNYAKTGLPVINSKHVRPNRVVLEGNRFALAHPVVDLQIRSGDTLINGTGRGTIERAAPYLNETFLRSNSLDPAYLSLYLNSAAGINRSYQPPP